MMTKVTMDMAEDVAQRTRRLHTLLSPRSVALIGASADTTKIRGALTKQLCGHNYTGGIHLVNPSGASIGGRKCYASIEDIGSPVDLAIVAIPAASVLDEVRKCVRLGVGNLLIVSSGFAEGGEEASRMQADIMAAVEGTQTRICGPNAEGFYNEILQLAATFSPVVEPAPYAGVPRVEAKRIGIVAQSGGVGFGLFNRVRAAGLAASYVVSTGNEVDVTSADFLRFMAEDNDTGVILLFLETVRDAGTFLEAARLAAHRGKSIVAIKVGASSAGQRATASHTASMAGWDVAYRTAFAQCGIVEAADFDDAVAIASILATNPPAHGRRAAVLTLSGGAGAWLADALTNVGFEIPELGQEARAAIAPLIPSYGSTHNPVDVTGQAYGTPAMGEVLDAIGRSGEVDVVVIGATLFSDHRLAIQPAVLKEIIERTGKPHILFSYTLPSDFAREKFAAAGIPVLTSVEQTARAVRALHRVEPRSEYETVRPLPALTLTKGEGILSEHRSKLILKQAGVPIADEMLATGEVELSAAAKTLGFPLAIKIQSPDIPHKSEVGGVRLRLSGMDDLLSAYRDMLRNVAIHEPKARIEGVLVQRMAAAGVEVIVGAVNDPAFGPVLSVGYGGVTAELFKDVTHALAPVGEAEARELLRKLKSWPLLAGYRGKPAADVDALVDVVVAIAAFAHDHRGQVSEVELNPVIVHEAGKGVTVADALVRMNG